MIKLFLSSHGTFASGLKSSVDILLGGAKNLTVFDAYLDETNPQDILTDYFAGVSAEDQVVLLSDLYGGSVNNLMYQWLSRPNTFLISGVNLALVLELGLYTEEVTDEYLEELVESSRAAMKLVRQDTTQSDESDDFFGDDL